MRISVHAFIAFALIAGFARAQQVPVEPASTHIFPAGGRRGESVAVRVGGECLPPASRLRFWGTGVTAQEVVGEAATAVYEPSPRRKPLETPNTYPRDWEATVSIAADAPLGTVLWRLSSGRGGVSGRPFVVGDLAEFIESESNSRVETAEPVTLPATINGQIAGECDLDYYRFSARAGEVVRADVAAARLGSPLEAVVEFRATDGGRLKFQEARAGADAVVALRVPADGEYLLLIRNLSFRGGPDHVYRATLSVAPYVTAVFPAGWQAGVAREFEFLALSGEFEPLVLRSELSLPPSAMGEQWLESPIAGANRLPLVAGDLPEFVEAEPNDSQAAAELLAWPATVNGRFLALDDEDWYRCDVAADAYLAIECQGYPRGGAALPRVSLHDASGGTLAQASAVDFIAGRCRLEWRSPAAGQIWLRVADVQRGARGGADFIYRLSVRPAATDFSLRLRADFANLLPGGRAEIDLDVERGGTWTVPIEVSVAGLPEGVAAEPLSLAPGQPTAKLVLTAAADVRPQDADLTVVGRALVGEQTLERRADATHRGHDADGLGLGPSETDHLRLTVQHKPLFKLYCNEAYQYAHRGTVHSYLMEVERLDGFDGPIHLQVADRQIKDLDGIELRDIAFPPGASQVMLPLYLPETMHINVQAHSNVYAQGWVRFQDAWGQEQSLLVVSTMRCMIRTLPTVVKLRSVEREFAALPGQTVAVALELDRTPNFDGPLRLELVEPSPEQGYTAAPVVVPAGASTATLSVVIAADACLPGKGNAAASRPFALLFRATGEMSDGAQVISEVRLPVK